jgi:3-oxoacyl-[acyl-carrier protein] reductase
MKKLAGKIALVTGSTRGIGKAIALELASMGATVLIHGSKKSQSKEVFARSIRKSSPKSKIYYARIDKLQEISSMADEIKKDFSHIDILVNNAGLVKNRMFLKMGMEDWDSVIKINLYGTFYVTKSLAPLLMQSKQGRVVNMSSISGSLGEYGQTNYCAAKAGIIGFSKALAKELAKYDITVNAVCPAVIASEAVDKIPKNYRDQLMQKIPLGRAGEKEEVAKLVGFLCTSDAAYITGQAIHINGGMY